MNITSKAVFDITGVGTILSFGITVGSERISTFFTGKRINSFLIYHLRVGIPPLNTTFITTEF
jgi:hypothetical protein